MKIRTKLKRLKAENEKLKSELEFYSARRAIPNLSVRECPVETITAQKTYDGRFLKHLEDNKINFNFEEDIVFSMLDEIRKYASIAYRDDLLTFSRIYKAELKIVVNKGGE